MNSYFLFLPLFGFALLYIALVRRKRFKQQLELIGQNKKNIEVIKPSTIDYEQMIILNSPILRLLSRLDKDVSFKLKFTAIFGACSYLISLLMGQPLVMKDIVVTLMLSLTSVIFIPGVLIKSALKNKMQRMLSSLPYFIELLAVSVQTGITIETALRFIAPYFTPLDRNLSTLIQHLLKRAEVIGMEESLIEFYNTVPLVEMRMVCSKLQQSVHFGSSLYTTLIELAQDIRDLRLLMIEEKIGKISAQSSLPLILFIMFPIIVLIIAPGLLKVSSNGLF